MIVDSLYLLPLFHGFLTFQILCWMFPVTFKGIFKYVFFLTYFYSLNGKLSAIYQVMTEIGILLPKSAFIFYFLYISGHMSSPIPNGRHYGYCTFYMFLLKTFTEMLSALFLSQNPLLVLFMHAILVLHFI